MLCCGLLAHIWSNICGCHLWAGKVGLGLSVALVVTRTSRRKVSSGKNSPAFDLLPAKISFAGFFLPGSDFSARGRGFSAHTG